MSWESEDAEAAWAEHIAECDVCAQALADGKPLFGPGCSEYEDPDDVAEQYPEWSGRFVTHMKGLD